MVLQAQVLGLLPQGLRDELIAALAEIERNFRERRWEPAELNGGKLCEVAYSILKGYIDGTFPANAYKPANMVDACRALEQSPSTFPRSIRVQIPRMLMALYEIRNNRGVGHVGGDVSANHMDSTCVLQMSKWVVSELIRVFHNTSTEDAETTVDALSEREISLIWEVAGRRRVLRPKMTMLEKTLVLLYGSTAPLTERELLDSIEHSNASAFRRDILRPAHQRRILEFDEETKLVHLSPLGSQLVEEHILTK
jgi:hypothetical protein